MNNTIRRAAVLAAALAVPAAAQVSPEALSASAGARFEAAAFAASPAQFRPLGSAGAPKLDADGSSDFLKELNATASEPAVTAEWWAAPTLASDLDLAVLLNRHLKTSLKYQLSGRAVWFSGTFDKDQKPYVSVLADGQAPRFFDVRALVDRDQQVFVGGASYTLSVSPNIFHKMRSTIILKNDANSREQARFSVQDMLDAVTAAGQAVALSGQAYKFFYADGLNGGGRMFAFLPVGVKDLHVFLIPESSVPTDRLGVFTLLGGRRVGLVRRDGRLQVFENP